MVIDQSGRRVRERPTELPDRTTSRDRRKKAQMNRKTLEKKSFQVNLIISHMLSCVNAIRLRQVCRSNNGKVIKIKSFPKEQRRLFESSILAHLTDARNQTNATTAFTSIYEVPSNSLKTTRSKGLAAAGTITIHILQRLTFHMTLMHFLAKLSSFYNLDYQSFSE
ncbi:hypothetical protein CSKR_105420 [Clonorchis sinensis]|uniref:Uncharacterized protein n=1 Tax=Clonorchis sinensis TaxID=79923 RepID=A0A3R7D332_CLOSI|nr:hypothetical protein CSKR_105420 [Clonorchis sinensis]